MIDLSAQAMTRDRADRVGSVNGPLWQELSSRVDGLLKQAGALADQAIHVEERLLGPLPMNSAMDPSPPTTDGTALVPGLLSDLSQVERALNRVERALSRVGSGL